MIVYIVMYTESEETATVFANLEDAKRHAEEEISRVNDWPELPSEYVWRPDGVGNFDLGKPHQRFGFFNEASALTQTVRKQARRKKPPGPEAPQLRAG
jgi:hypothetical protein